MRHLAAGGVGDVDSGVVEQQAGRAIEFDAGFLIRRFRRNQIRFAGRQGRSILQDRGLCGESYLEFLLIGVEGLAREIDCRLRSFDGRAVLLDVKLRIADLNAHLILKLMLADERLPIFEFGANLIGLRQAIADGNVQGEADAFVGSSGIDQLIQGSAIADRRCRAEYRRLRARCAVGFDTLPVEVSSLPRAAIIDVGVQRRQHGIANRFHVEVARVQIDARFHQFGPMLERIVD